MGRDEHKKSRGKRFLTQTPENQASDGIDIEFSEELADQSDKIAQERRKRADESAKR
ncbi:YfhD family protein [Virgibacillus sp. W0181]|uniref:YfhD family protein n=1 Tax=Virgibacillus sp. W0181 TaxID=3391581 RepID=UPI003F468E80